MRGIEPVAWVAAVGGGLGLGYLLARPEIQAFIENSGVNIPTREVVVDYAGGVAWACVLLLFVLTWPVSWAHKRLLVGGWLVKCFVALVVMLPYEQQYPGLDCWTYFQRAHLGLAELSPRVMNGGADLVVWLGALHLKVGPDSYQAMKLSFAMIGLVGVYLFFRAAKALLGHPSPVAFWALLLYPSVLFWSTILGKDPLILAAISLYAWGVVNVALRGRSAYLVAVLVGIGAASVVRIWMGPILVLPCLLVLGMRISSLLWRLSAVALIGLTLVFLAPATADRLQLDKAADILGRQPEPSTTVGMRIRRSRLTPNSILSGISCYPLRKECSSLSSAHSLEMSITFSECSPAVRISGSSLLAASALLRIRLIHFRNHLFLWSTVLLLTWGLAYSVVAYKDLGTAVRFKLQIIPVMLGLIGFLLHQPSRKMASQMPTRPGRSFAVS